MKVITIVYNYLNDTSENQTNNNNKNLIIQIANEVNTQCMKTSWSENWKMQDVKVSQSFNDRPAEN